MADLNWIEEVEGLTAAELTVQAQAIGVDDADPADMLLHPAFMPYEDTGSVEIAHIFETDDRTVSDFRAWNAEGRLIPTQAPDIDKLTMTPIEAYDKIGEYEQQRLMERSMGNEDVYRRLLMASVPDRVDKFAKSNFRRVEIAALEGWAKGTVTVMHPQKGTTYQLTLADDGRRQVAATAWNDGAVNAYQEFYDWYEEGRDEIGAAQGVVIDRPSLNAILNDAPNNLPGAQAGLRPSRSRLQQLLSDEFGESFTFYIVEKSVDTYVDGGTETARTKIWPRGYAALVPAGGVVGRTYRAPNRRAYELANALPNAGIDVNGQTAYYAPENSGKTLKVAVQALHLPLTMRNRVWTIDTGIRPA